MVRILVAEDHEIVRRGICSLIEAHGDWQVCGEAGNGIEAVDLALEMEPDIAIIDYRMPGLDGLDVIREMAMRLPKLQILFLSQLDAEPLIREALEAGARGFLAKSEAGEQLEEAISDLIAGRRYVAERFSGLLPKSQ